MPPLGIHWFSQPFKTESLGLLLLFWLHSGDIPFAMVVFRGNFRVKR